MYAMPTRGKEEEVHRYLQGCVGCVGGVMFLLQCKRSALTLWSRVPIGPRPFTNLRHLASSCGAGIGYLVA